MPCLVGSLMCIRDSSSNTHHSEYVCVFHRSSGTQDDTDSAWVFGTNATHNQLRIMKTATGVYELQQLSTGSYDATIAEMFVLGERGLVFTPATSIVNGSTSGTAYVAGTSGAGSQTMAIPRARFATDVGIGVASVLAPLHVSTSDSSCLLYTSPSQRD